MTPGFYWYRGPFISNRAKQHYCGSWIVVRIDNERL